MREIRQIKEIGWLVKRVNERGAQLEFIGEYRQYRNRIYKCILRLKGESLTYAMDCQVEIPMIMKTEYCWNASRPECA